MDTDLALSLEDIMIDHSDCEMDITGSIPSFKLT